LAGKVNASPAARWRLRSPLGSPLVVQVKEIAVQAFLIIRKLRAAFPRNFSDLEKVSARQL